jgi:hypothetical protein
MEDLVEKVDVAEKFDLFSDYWSPKVVGVHPSYKDARQNKGPERDPIGNPIQRPKNQI